MSLTSVGKKLVQLAVSKENAIKMYF